MKELPQEPLLNLEIGGKRCSPDGIIVGILDLILRESHVCVLPEYMEHLLVKLVFGEEVNGVELCRMEADRTLENLSF